MHRFAVTHSRTQAAAAAAGSSIVFLFARAGMMSLFVPGGGLALFGRGGEAAATWLRLWRYGALFVRDGMVFRLLLRVLWHRSCVVVTLSYTSTPCDLPFV